MSIGKTRIARESDGRLITINPCDRAGDPYPSLGAALAAMTDAGEIPPGTWHIEEEITVTRRIWRAHGLRWSVSDEGGAS